MRARLPVLIVAMLAGLGLILGPFVEPSQAMLATREAYRESGKVLKVLDGDTIDIRESSGKRQRVRVIGIQAPEVHWCGGPAATAALKRALPVGTFVRLASVKASSGNAPTGVWRVKRTVYKKSGGRWVNVAPALVSAGLVFPFPFQGETAHNAQYMQLAAAAASARIGLYEPNHCGSQRSARERLKLEVVEGAPGPDPSANAEFVMVFNGSDHDVSLTGWMVQDTSPLNAYFFPKGSVVRANDYVVVFSGKGTRGVAPGGGRDSRVFYSNKGMIWTEKVAEIAFLFDNAGSADTGNLRDWLIMGNG